MKKVHIYHRQTRQDPPSHTQIRIRGGRFILQWLTRQRTYRLRQGIILSGVLHTLKIHLRTLFQTVPIPGMEL